MSVSKLIYYKNSTALMVINDLHSREASSYDLGDGTTIYYSSLDDKGIFYEVLATRTDVHDDDGNTILNFGVDKLSNWMIIPSSEKRWLGTPYEISTLLGVNVRKIYLNDLSLLRGTYNFHECYVDEEKLVNLVNPYLESDESYDSYYGLASRLMTKFNPSVNIEGHDQKDTEGYLSWKSDLKNYQYERLFHE